MVERCRNCERFESIGHPKCHTTGRQNNSPWSHQSCLNSVVCIGVEELFMFTHLKNNGKNGLQRMLILHDLFSIVFCYSLHSLPKIRVPGNMRTLAVILRDDCSKTTRRSWSVFFECRGEFFNLDIKMNITNSHLMNAEIQRGTTEMWVMSLILMEGSFENSSRTTFVPVGFKIKTQ